MTAEQIQGFGFSEALQAIAEIFKSISKPANSEREKRRNLRHAKKNMKFLKRQLKKDGWEKWEQELWDETIEKYAKKIQEL